MDFLAASQIICSICQEKLIEDSCTDVEVLGTPCGHVYHKTCLATWFQKGEPERRANQRINPEELLRGECPNCFKPQWLKRCIRIYLSCDEGDTNQVRSFFDQMETELKDAKQQVASSKLEIADAKKQAVDAKKQAAASKRELAQAEMTIKEQAALLDKSKKTTKKAPQEINNNIRKKTAPASSITTTAAAPSISLPVTIAKATTSTSRAAVAKATAKATGAGVTSKAKVATTTVKLSPAVAKIRQHAKLGATLSTESEASSVASSGSVYSPPQGRVVKTRAPVVRPAVMTRSRARTASEAAAAPATTSAVCRQNLSATTAIRNQRTVRTGLAGNPFSLHH